MAKYRLTTSYRSPVFGSHEAGEVLDIPPAGVRVSTLDDGSPASREPHHAWIPLDDDALQAVNAVRAAKGLKPVAEVAR